MIQAPHPAPPPPVQSAPDYSQAPAAAPPYAGQPQYESPPGYEAPDYYAPPRPQPQYQHRQPQPPQGQPTVLRPAPRQLPDRTEAIESPTRARRDPSGDIRPRAEPAGPPPERHHRSRFVRALVPLVFLCIALGVVSGVKSFLQTDRNQPEEKAASAGAGGSTVKPILPPDNTFEALTGEGTETLPVGDPDMPEIGGNQPEAPAPPIDSGIAALRLLEEFLEMKSLDERLPHLESKLGEAVLASSVLNGPLPEVLKTTVDIREINSIELVTDHYYHVDFADDEGGVNPQTMLVRTRGTAPPKVVVDPFLDLFGGRFERYAAEPTKEAGTFQVVISAGGKCYEDIPDAEKKITMKILTREDTKEIARAYFGEQSEIARMLQDENSGLSYGMTKACTVFMRWNMEDDPERPFLEALRITELNWNP